MRLIGIIAAAAAISTVAAAESVYVKYRGEVDLKVFDCSAITRSSFIERVCYDQRNEYMLISLNGTFLRNRPQYGVVPPERSLDGKVLQRQHQGHFDCRLRRVPVY